MNHCRDCKHWGDEQDRKHNRSRRLCTYLAPPSSSDLVRIIAHGREIGLLIASPDFGCVLFQQRKD